MLTRQVKILARLGTLARQIEKLARLCHAGTLVRLLARWHVKMRSWHAFGTLAHGHVHHAGTYGTHGTRFSKLTENELKKKICLLTFYLNHFKINLCLEGR